VNTRHARAELIAGAHLVELLAVRIATTTPPRPRSRSPPRPGGELNSPCYSTALNSFIGPIRDVDPVPDGCPVLTAVPTSNDQMYLMLRWTAVRISTSAQPVLPVAPTLEILTHEREDSALRNRTPHE